MNFLFHSLNLREFLFTLNLNLNMRPESKKILKEIKRKFLLLTIALILLFTLNVFMIYDTYNDEMYVFTIIDSILALAMIGLCFFARYKYKETVKVITELDEKLDNLKNKYNHND